MTAYEFILKMKNYASSELKKVASELGVVDRKADQTFKNAKRSSDSWGNSLGGLKGKLMGLVAGFSLMAFTGQVIEARSEYEKFDAVLTNTFQDKDVGQGALAMLTRFSAQTPYQLNEVTGSFIKLANRGIAPTYFEMTKLGDLASSQGKSFDQLTEAIMDAQTGEFERMKEFGIRASKAGDKVSLTFKGVTKTVQMNDKAIKDAILTYGEMAGVAGSMEVISKTLGGRISNLKDQWWSFLVTVGGASGGVFGEFIGYASEALGFLTTHLPEISMWFEILGQNLSPLVDSVQNFLKAAFGFSDAGSALQTFGNIMSGILLVVDWFASGLSYMLDNLSPLAPFLAVATAAVWLFNLSLWSNPVGLVVAAIIVLITIIGMLIKYTDGWGKSWEALKIIVSSVWNQIKADFKMGVDIGIYQFNRLRYSAFEIFDRIGQKVANVGQAIKQALNLDFDGAFNSLNKEITSKYTDLLKKNEAEFKNKAVSYLKDTSKRAGDIKKSVGDIGISVDTNGISRDFKKLKSSFNGLSGGSLGNEKNYTDYLNKGSKSIPGAPAGGIGSGKDKKGDGAPEKRDGIVSGGSKQTHIVINIDKVGTDTKIYVSSSEQGVKNLGEKVQEELLKAINSVNQMQTE